jgi:hypothetical protein
VERGASRPRHRPNSGRGHHQGPPDRRRAWATARVRGHGRPAPRHRMRAGVGAAYAATPAACRQGLQHPRLPRGARRDGLRPGDCVIVIVDQSAVV